MVQKNLPQSVDDLYPARWLKAEDLGGKVVNVKIADVMVETFRQPSGESKQAVVLAFERAHKRLILNVTQCQAMARLAGTSVFNDWVGLTVQLAPATAPNGKGTIEVRPGRET